MKLCVLTNLFGDLTLEEALVKFEKLGIEAVIRESPIFRVSGEA